MTAEARASRAASSAASHAASRAASRAEGEVVLISGGSRGLGRALVEKCREAGYIVATYSRTATPFIQEQAALDPEGHGFLWEPIDGADAVAVKRFASGVFEKYGRIDALINNAGAGTDGILSSMRLADIDACVDLNLKGALYLSWACSRFMLHQNRGTIINISSVNAIRGHAGVAVYSATKAALDGLTRSLARELGARNIRVNSVAPGYFESDMVGELSPAAKGRIERRTPLGRLGTVDDVAGAVMFLLSPQASFITGHTLVVDGGLTC